MQPSSFLCFVALVYLDISFSHVSTLYIRIHFANCASPTFSILHVQLKDLRLQADVLELLKLLVSKFDMASSVTAGLVTLLKIEPETFDK